MKVFFLVLVATVYIASALPVEEQRQKHVYSRFIEIPDDEGNMHLVDLEAEPDMAAIEEHTRNPNNNVYLLYTRRNQIFSQTLVMNDENSIINSNFNPNDPTIVIVHGWISSRESEPNPTVRSAFLSTSEVNVISVEWRELAFSDYVTAVNGVPAVGRGIGQFLIFLNRVTGARFDQMHLVGFSLGAHVVGNAGRETGGRVARVTGLDPSGPLWNYNNERLNADDGVYVEAIHTDGGVLGIGLPIVQVDFFPNGGFYQPGCLVTTRCNHDRAWELFAVSVTHGHLFGRRCLTMLQVTTDLCTSDTLQLGNDNLRKTGSGMYRVNTGSRHPF
ncbi:hepatic triacylglycerol lipase-like [Hyposmocoma kahamanoa]|uniref:hepatic triacylglycerol lipase-like n=1 Tax=Hyposmocoma kahamanoa TaxID=1477025 RepID=UPI000E6D7C06|nr:hepatic triacylglycerol lipase-like [Hyposmocoma kahamanoa]